MLEQISYIDDCDTLGQRGDKKDIHKVIYISIFEARLTSCRHWYWCTRKY